jgi:hypothetical protein
VDVGAWCGRCGQRFRLLEIVEPAHPAACPRCGEPLAPGYAAVVVSTAREVAAAAAALEAAANRLRDVAPALHVDTAALGERLRESVDH